MPSPRSWLENPAYFSQGSQSWKASSRPAEAAEILAARWQQNVARKLRAEARLQNLNLTQLAAVAGCSHDAVSRIVNGESWLDLRGITMFEVRLGVDLLFDTRPEE